MLRWLSRKVRQERFFCIMSWSMPVIAMVVNIPARNCFQKKRVSRQSSRNQTRLIPLSRMAPHIAPKSRPMLRPITTVQITTVAISARVWSMSVQTSERTPPRKV